MRFPEDFQYSQANLQDFVDCWKRFYLRHISRLVWPALETEPAMQLERAGRDGARFHRLVHQCLVGIPPQRLSAMLGDPDLELWWAYFLEFLPEVYGAESQGRYPLHPEVNLSAPLGSRRLVARYDLIVAALGESLVIYDWKTSRQRPDRGHLEQHLQTRVYPYLLVRAGWHLNRGLLVQPDQVEMVYWFAGEDEPVERFIYSAEAFQTDESYLTGLVATIERLEAEEFSRTSDERRCLYCSYRSLCDRGVLPGNVRELGTESAFGFESERLKITEIDD